MSELPLGWVACELGQVAQIVGGGTPPSKDPANFDTAGGIPWVTPADLSGYKGMYIARGLRNLTQKGLSACSARLLPPGTVLFSSRAPIGYVAIASNPLTTNQGFKSFILPKEIEPRFVYHYLRHIKPIAEALATGTTFKELSGAAAARLPLQLAPVPEQKRIADKLDALIARVDSCRERLDRVPLILKRFRQSVLATATNGELTREWREARGLKEWSEVKLENVASEFSYGSAAKSAKAGKVPVLRMGNIQDGLLDWEDLVFTSDAAEIEKYRLSPGDVLFNRTNSPELVGKTAVYRDEREAIYAGYLIRVRCGELLLPEYLNYCLGSPAGRDYCWQVKTDGVSQSNINARKLAAFTFLLPSIAEQEEVVRRVEELLALNRALMSRTEAAAQRVEQLTPSILAKAFRGELVPQDPSDEPASELLARVQAQRSTQTAEPHRRRPKAVRKNSTMSNSHNEAIKVAISKLKAGRFSFDELREQVPGDYESIKEALFELLQESNPVVRQVFDKKAKAMRLVKVAR